MSQPFCTSLLLYVYPLKNDQLETYPLLIPVVKPTFFSLCGLDGADLRETPPPLPTTIIGRPETTHHCFLSLNPHLFCYALLMELIPETPHLPHAQHIIKR